MNHTTDSNYKLTQGKLLAEGEKKATVCIIYIYNTCTCSGTQQRPFDLWLILRAWPHTPLAFWKHQAKPATFLPDTGTTRSDHNTGTLCPTLFEHCVGSFTSCRDNRDF